MTKGEAVGWVWGVVVVMSILLLIFKIGWTVGNSHVKEFKVEAVKKGFAEWSVDGEGRTTFEWKDETEEQ